MFKKSMSGLIITVLLVAIALSIGTIIIGWITSYSKGSLSKAKVTQLVQDACSDLDISYVKIKIDDSDDPSSTESISLNVSVLVENNGPQPLAGVVIKAYPNNEDYVYAKKLEYKLDQYERHKYTFTQNTESEAGASYINTIEVIPLVEVNPGTPEIHECSAMAQKFSRSDSLVRT